MCTILGVWKRPAATERMHNKNYIYFVKHRDINASYVRSVEMQMFWFRCLYNLNRNTTFDIRNLAEIRITGWHIITSFFHSARCSYSTFKRSFMHSILDHK